MGKSAADFQGILVALSMKKHMGMNIDKELEDVIRTCQSEEDKKIVLQIARALGLK